MGGDLRFSLTLARSGGALGKLRIEYGIDFLRSNGDLSRKVFKISEIETEERSRRIERRHSFRKISTRRYYPGNHRVAIIINGVEFVSSVFELER